MTIRESVELTDIRQAVEEAQREAANVDRDAGPFGEVMATFAALGELLDSGRTDERLDQECRDVADRLIKLEAWVDRWSDQRWAVWMTRNAMPGGDVEQ